MSRGPQWEDEPDRGFEDDYARRGGGGLAQSMVNGPATGLLITGILWIVFALLGIAMNLLQVGMFADAAKKAPGAQQDFQMVMFSGTISVIVGIVAVVLGVIIIFGALKMKSLESFGLAMASSIIAMIPVSCCCLLGLPMGIWSIVTLNKPEVKSAFR